jgi:tricorn protease
MIINGWSGSGGDALPYYFKKAGLGDIVGKRTLGGLIGIGGYPRLIDGGYVTAPAYAFFDTMGMWGVEGYGVDPDLEIENLSNNNPGSSDPQLDAAINILINRLSGLNNKNIQVPHYPDRSGNNMLH